MRSRFLSYTCVIYFGLKLCLLLFVLVSFNFNFENASKFNWISQLISIRRQDRNVLPKTDQDQQVSYPWIAGHPSCQHYSVKFAKNFTRPKWPLTSFPGSGVTWTRQLIEGVTGIYTGTVYGPDEPGIIDGKHYGNQADFNCGCTILVKDHGYPETYPFLGSSSVYENRGILLLRNPIEALFSSAHYLWSDNKQMGTVSPDLFKGPKWDDYVSNVTIEWAEHADRWIQNIRNGTVIFYEKLLLEDTEAELNRLFRAINFMPIDPERMRCTLSHQSRSDRKRPKKPTAPLTSKHYSKLTSTIERVQESLRRKGWPLIPLHLYNLKKLFERNEESLGII